MVMISIALFRPFLDFFETISRVVWYVSAFIYIFPVIEYQVQGSGFLLVVKWLLQVSRYLTLTLLLLNVPLTTYVPFGKTVLSRHAFLTKITGFPSYFILSMLALALLTVTRQDEVEFVFSNITQTESFNLTAYLAGASDFIVQDSTFVDELDTFVEFAFVYAQLGLFLGSLVFAFVSYFGDKFSEPEEFTAAEEWSLSWYTRTWQERPATMGALGLPRRGPLLRNSTLLLLSGAAFLLNLVDFLLATSDAKAAGLLIFLAEMVFSGLLFAYSLRKVLLNARQNFVVYPAYFADIYFVMQLHFYIAVTSPTLAGFDSRVFYAGAGPALIILVWVITFNRSLPAVTVWSVQDLNRIAAVNLREPQRFYRLFSSIAISAGIIAIFFCYYAYIGNAFEFDFSSGNAVDAVSEVLEDVEDVFDDTIRAVNAFLLVITPCSTTSGFWQNASSVGQTGGSVTSASAISQLRDNDYYDVCFVDNGPTADFIRPVTDQVCVEPVANYDELVAQEAEAADVRANQAPGGIRNDTQFVDDEGQPPDPGLQVLTIDGDCAGKLCVAFTVLTTALFAASLIPFVNIGAATASKVARVAWRVSQIGRRMLKRARKLYAKRRKLFRFTKLVRKLAAVGSPILKFNTAILFMFIPVVLVGLLCILLGFFRRPRGLPPLSTNARTRVLFIFIGLTLFNFALYVGFFGLNAAGDNSLRFVQHTMDNLPPLVIRSSVKYGAGILYLRLCLLVSMASSAAMAISISASFLLDRIVALRKALFRSGTRTRAGRSRMRGGRKPKPDERGKTRYTPLTIGEDWFPAIDIQAEAGVAVDAASTSNRAPLNYAILVVFLIAPVCFFAAQSYGNPNVRWFRMVALQDDRMADITEQIAASEVVEDSTSIIDEDSSTEGFNCGLVGVAAEVVFNALIDVLHAAIQPLFQKLLQLRTFATDLLGQIRIGTLFAPINLNLPLVDNSEFWVVFTLPLVVVAVAVAAILADIFQRYTGSRNGKLEFLLASVKGIILALGLAAFQIDLILHSLFSSLNGLDVPLFNVQVEMGDMLVFSLYSSIMCVATGVVLYMYEFLL